MNLNDQLPSNRSYGETTGQTAIREGAHVLEFAIGSVLLYKGLTYVVDHGRALECRFKSFFLKVFGPKS